MEFFWYSKYNIYLYIYIYKVVYENYTIKSFFLRSNKEKIIIKKVYVKKKKKLEVYTSI